jgi:hypothetical protein
MQAVDGAGGTRGGPAGTGAGRDMSKTPKTPRRL